MTTVRMTPEEIIQALQTDSLPLAEIELTETVHLSTEHVPIRTTEH